MTTDICMETKCWSCGDVSDRVSNIKSEEPEPVNGDISFCFSCGQFAIFDNTFVDKIRKPSPSESFDIRNNEELAEVKAMWVKHVVPRRRLS